MEGLHARRKIKTYPEDELEFLDETEQETLLQDLRNQNDAANSNILKGLLAIDCLTSSLYLSLLVQSSRKPIIPIANIVVTIYGSLSLFRTAAISSILSISLSFVVLVIKSKIDLFGMNSLLSVDPQHASLIGACSIILGAVGPIICLFYTTSLAELAFWSIPILVLSIYYAAYYMMKQVQNDIEKLEQSNMNWLKIKINLFEGTKPGSLKQNM